MPTITIAAKASTTVFPILAAAAVTSVTVNGTPVAYTFTGSAIRLAAPLSADATVVFTYDATNANAGAMEYRLLELNARLAAFDALNIGARLTALEA